jgi:hypothetical protein
MPLLTPQEYVAIRGVKCPFCCSDDLNGDDFNVDQGTCSQEISCLACGKGWHDIYQLTGYEESVD